MSRDSNIEATEKGYAAFGAGDAEATMASIADDVEWIVPGRSKLSGTYHGKAEVGGMLAMMAEKSGTTTPSRFLADEDVVVVLTQLSAGGETAGQADVYTFRDGKIVKATSYGDTAMLERVFGTR